MFLRQYYALDEAANLLGVDTETIFQNAKLGKVNLSIVKKNYGMVLHADMSRDSITYENLTKLLVRDDRLVNNHAYEDLSVYLDSYHQFKIINNEKVFVCSYEKPYLDEFPEKTVLLRGSDSQFRFFYFEEKHRNISCDDLVVSHNEFVRLKSLTSEKPTYVQLEAENELLKQRIDELEAKQSTYSTQPNATSKASINAFFKALNASYGKSLDVPRIIKAAEELGEKISDKTIYKYLDKGV